MSNEYEKQATDFLESTKTTFEIVEAVPQKKPLWAKGEEKNGIHYSVTLKNDRHSYTFDFWGSIHDREGIEALSEIAQNRGRTDSEHKASAFLLEKTGKKVFFDKYSFRDAYTAKRELEKMSSLMPTAYDVLACLTVYGDTFEDFCFNFGYDEDSRQAYKTWIACNEQENNLRKLFSFEDVEKLQDIS